MQTSNKTKTDNLVRLANSIAKLLVLTATLLASSQLNASTAVPLKVMLPSEGLSLQFSAPQRLDQVLAEAANHTKTVPVLATPFYNRLFDLQKTEIAVQKKTQAKEQLEYLIKEQRFESKDIRSLLSQLNNLNVGFRVFHTLDYDRVRISLENNPVLEGRFSLETIDVPSTVTIFGVTKKRSELPYDPNKTIADYLDAVTTLLSAHPSYIWVIHPDGVIYRVGYAYWNAVETPVIPGTTLFVGLNSDRDNDLALERLIAALLTNQHLHSSMAQ